MKYVTLSTAAGLTLALTPVSAATAPGPDTCLVGYVWREARPTDRVCVTPKVRDRTALENRLK
ncbi:hypothetical protein AB0K16_19775 [Nonomuraea jabiensis]|uniref:hypothetical protein n=1 Tax=Nonomuraea jabiensis TaxID=882448 RepID=UPI0034418A7C